MTIDDERELRRRLDSVLEAITPSPAPVAATLRRGGTIRTWRRVGVAVGLAAAVGIALAAPGLVHQIVGRAAITSHEHEWVVTVYPPGPHHPTGEVAWGTINGKRWQITVSSAGQCVQGRFNGQDGDLDCGGPITASQDRSVPVIFTGTGDSRVTFQAGVVQPDVARIVVSLAGGRKLTLQPYPLDGQRWVAFAVPVGLPILNGIAYSTKSELAHSVPYGDDFVTWLRPGEHGRAPATYVIGSGVVDGVSWSAVLHVGPWGYCLDTPGSTYCLGAQSSLDNTYRAGGLIAGGSLLVNGEATASVAYVVGTLTDGRTVRATVVDVGGPRFWAWVVPSGQRLRRVVFYTASGRQVAVQSGAKYNLGI